MKEGIDPEKLAGIAQDAEARQPASLEYHKIQDQLPEARITWSDWKLDPTPSSYRTWRRRGKCQEAPDLDIEVKKMECPGNKTEYVAHVWGKDEELICEVSGGEEAARFEVAKTLKDRAEGSSEWRDGIEI